MQNTKYCFNTEYSEMARPIQYWHPGGYTISLYGIIIINSIITISLYATCM